MQESNREIIITILITFALVFLLIFIFFLLGVRMQDAVDECIEIFGNESAACKTALSEFHEAKVRCIEECSEINKKTGWSCVC